MNWYSGFQTLNKIRIWKEVKQDKHHDLLENEQRVIIYDTALLPIPSLAWDLDSTQNRYFLFANKNIAIADTFFDKPSEAIIFSEELSPNKGTIRDLKWFPSDNSLSATISNLGAFSLIDMKRMKIADRFDLLTSCNCINFDQSGQFPFCVTIGTKSGLRICDLKSGSHVQNLKSLYSVNCVEYSSRNQYEVFTGLETGSVIVWDVRHTSRPLFDIVPLTKFKNSVKTIYQSANTNGSILVGYKNGSIALYSYIDLILLWEQNFGGSGKFAIKNFSEFILPINNNIIFIDVLIGKTLSSYQNDKISSLTSIAINSSNNDIFVFDPNYIGSIFRLNPKYALDEK